MLHDNILPPAEAPVQEKRRAVRKTVSLQGRLGYGGASPGLVGCDILDLSETGARVETFAQLEQVPDIVSLEICGVYTRARRRWVDERKIGVEFILEDMEYFNGVPANARFLALIAPD